MAIVIKCDACGKEFVRDTAVKVSITIGFCRDYPELKITDMCNQCAVSLKSWYEQKRIRNGKVPFPNTFKQGGE